MSLCIDTYELSEEYAVDEQGISILFKKRENVTEFAGKKRLPADCFSERPTSMRTDLASIAKYYLADVFPCIGHSLAQSTDYH